MFPCEIKEQPAQNVLTIRFRSSVQDLPGHFGRVFGSVMQYLGSLGEQPSGMPFSAYYNMDFENMDIEAGFPVAKPLPGNGEILANMIPAGKYAICHYTGPYDAAMPAYEQLTQFVADQGFAPTGVAYEYYLNGPDEVASTNELKTDIVFPVMTLPEKVTR